MTAINSIHLYVQNLDAGGAQPVMVTLANEFADRGIRTTLLSNNVRGVWRKSVGSHVRLHDLGAANTSHATLKLIGYLRANRPPALVSAMAHSNLAAIAAARAGFSSTKIIIAEHTTTSRWLKGQRPSRKLLFGLLMPLIYPMADGIVSVSQAAASDLATFLHVKNDRISVIYNSSPGEKSLTGLQQPEHPWFQSQEIPVIVAAGRLAPEKDFAMLIRAFAIARQERQMRLVFLGDGPLRQDLEREVAKHRLQNDILFMGHVSSVLPYFAHASLFAMSSQFEGFPLVIVEALSCGLPVVSTDCESGPREILQDSKGRLAQLAPVGDVEGMASAITATLAAPGDAERRRARAREFSVSRMADAYTSLVERTLGQ